MDSGDNGVLSLGVASPVVKEIKLRPDSATTHHLPMEELNALDQILTQLLAMKRNALLVTL
jgi:hypothetical protein